MLSWRSNLLLIIIVIIIITIDHHCDEEYEYDNNSNLKDANNLFVIESMK